MAILLDPKGQSITVKIKKPEQQHAEQGETSGKELQIKFGEPEQIDYGGNELNENMPVNYNKEENRLADLKAQLQATQQYYAELRRSNEREDVEAARNYPYNSSFKLRERRSTYVIPFELEDVIKPMVGLILARTN